MGHGRMGNLNKITHLPFEGVADDKEYHALPCRTKKKYQKLKLQYSSITEE